MASSSPKIPSLGLLYNCPGQPGRLAVSCQEEGDSCQSLMLPPGLSVRLWGLRTTCPFPGKPTRRTRNISQSFCESFIHSGKLY